MADGSFSDVTFELRRE